MSTKSEYKKLIKESVNTLNMQLHNKEISNYVYEVKMIGVNKKLKALRK
jgi:hypothetical protein